MLNEAGAWKIFGFDFCLNNQSSNELPKWRCNQMVESCEDLMPDLDFLGKLFNPLNARLFSTATPFKNWFWVSDFAFFYKKSKG